MPITFPVNTEAGYWVNWSMNVKVIKKYINEAGDLYILGIHGGQ